MNRFIFFLLALVSFTDNLYAQTDTEFWFAAPEVTSLHADEPVYLRISTTNSAARITISQPANLKFPLIVRDIPAKGILSINLTPYLSMLENDLPDAVLNKGLHITSTVGVTIYYEVVGNDHNAEIFVLKGNHALGKEFYIPAQTHWSNHPEIDAWCSFDIVAVEDNTEITIVPTQDLYNHQAQIPFTIVLNKGQTYSARAASTIGDGHPAGSHVSATKQIAITYKDDSLLDELHWDLVGDQLVPINILGTRYIALKITSNLKEDRIFITVVENNTQVFINGSLIGTFNAGASINQLILTSTIYVETNHPVYAFHVGGFEKELAGTLLPPLACTGSRQVSFIRSTPETFAMAILAKSGSEKYFKLNGKTFISDLAFSPVEGTSGSWLYAIIYDNKIVAALNSAIVTNDSADFHLAILNGGSSTGFRYGYFSDYGFLNLGADKSICSGEALTLDAGSGKSSYLWTNFITDSVLSYSSLLTIKDSGTYQVKVNKDTCSFSDQVTVRLLPPVIGPLLGNDTSVCKGEIFKVGPSLNFNQYLWNNGDTSRTKIVKNEGTFILSVKNKYGCQGTDSITVWYYPLPAPEILYEKEYDKFCMDSIVVVQASQTYNKYLWNSGDSTFSTSTKHTYPDKFTLSVLDNNGCRGLDSLEIDCSPFVGIIPNLITSNNDLKNDVFYIPFLQEDFWRLEVYNRWGSKVYSTPSYQNNWKGQDLNDGIYYYSLEHKAGKKKINGIVEIVR